MRTILSILVGLALRSFGSNRPVVVCGDPRREIFPRHAAADDARQRQHHTVDSLPCLAVRSALRALIVVGRYDVVWPGLRFIRHAVARSSKSNGHQAAAKSE